MLAVDTNVIIRYLTGDDPEQSPRARRLLDAQDVWVPTTALLETEWVLRGVYRYKPVQIAAALRRFAGLPRVTLENVPSLLRPWIGSSKDWILPTHCISAPLTTARHSRPSTQIS
jgi:predicted nucleic acid-binding protein